MKIKNLILFTNKLDLEKRFYTQILWFSLLNADETSFTVRIGWSTLTFRKSHKSHQYHYCFLIPSNKLKEALEWMKQRTTIIKDEAGDTTFRFESWNAEAFYFYDASGNIAEFIVRYDLKNESNLEFGVSNVLCINEIGMPTTDITRLNSELEINVGSMFWKGNDTTFGTNGSQEGLFLLPNFETKKCWYPTNEEIQPEPFEAIVACNGLQFELKFVNGMLLKPKPIEDFNQKSKL